MLELESSDFRRKSVDYKDHIPWSQLDVFGSPRSTGLEIAIMLPNTPEGVWSGSYVAGEGFLCGLQQIHAVKGWIFVRHGILF